MTQSGFYPLNDSQFDPNIRGESPAGFKIFRNIAVGAMTAGAKELTVKAPFGKNLGEVWGAQLLDTNGGAAVTGFTPDANPVLGIKAVVGTVAEGDVIVTITTLDATSTESALVVSFIVYGRILPVNA